MTKGEYLKSKGMRMSSIDPNSEATPEFMEFVDSLAENFMDIYEDGKDGKDGDADGRP